MLIDRIMARAAADIEREPVVIGLRADVARLERELALVRGKARGPAAREARREMRERTTAQLKAEIAR